MRVGEVVRFISGTGIVWSDNLRLGTETKEDRSRRCNVSPFGKIYLGVLYLLDLLHTS